MTDTGAVKKSEQMPPAEHVPLKTWIGLMGAMLGAFMAVLDIQITNSSLQATEPLEARRLVGNYHNGDWLGFIGGGFRRREPQRLVCF